LNVIRLDLPPLRERMEDLPALAEEGLSAIVARRGGPARRLSHAALQRLMKHSWPGNVRELNNVLETATILDQSPEIPVVHPRDSAPDGR
jgi:DNA-binding NtrC family response regulator